MGGSNNPCISQKRIKLPVIHLKHTYQTILTEIWRREIICIFSSTDLKNGPFDDLHLNEKQLGTPFIHSVNTECLLCNKLFPFNGEWHARPQILRDLYSRREMNKQVSERYCVWSSLEEANSGAVHVWGRGGMLATYVRFSAPATHPFALVPNFLRMNEFFPIVCSFRVHFLLPPPTPASTVTWPGKFAAGPLNSSLPPGWGGMGGGGGHGGGWCRGRIYGIL